MDKVQLIGRLGAAPEIRALNNGSRVANLRVATDDRRKVDGKWVTTPKWHRAVVFGDGNIKFLEQYVGSGDLVMIEGAIRYGKYTNQAGVEIPTFEIIVGGPQHNFKLLQSKRPNGAGEAAAKAQEERTAPTDEDVPF